MTATSPPHDKPGNTRIGQKEGDIVWITLDRPEKANALSSSLLTDILEALEAAERDPNVKAVILRGEGKHFCAGADLRELVDGGPRAIRRLLDLFREVCLRLERSALAVVGMAHGAVRAGGLELLLACDVVVALEDATFGDAHVLRELLPGGGSSVRLPRTVGHQRAKWLILSGATISAEEARDWGILHRTVPTERLKQAAVTLARSISVGDRKTVGRLKSLIYYSNTIGFDTALENEISMLEKHSTDSAMWESLKGFVRD
ncbi:enoyl-CoA hydratase/isomerase family protein [Bradyrhizobium sp. 186]|uniref:enoyl-CoA hydratase/isomerase family protein n=1 Tax=Bradyrhizobium sp. 186 TaxID=2782654 RepID=UPI00200090F4|nr:enoyl-CoA hydratase/isomerase family protein [Bradyrhizobium sp. 186]UPK34477.1 enoyl-CoA hydratase/isomerase family protein [Bradyrhizobium sp. 186]